MKWGLPEADAIRFEVIANRRVFGEYNYDCAKGLHIIRISQLRHTQLQTILMTMAHEMIHLREQQQGRRWDVQHGRAFCRMAAQVCKIHGFDLGAF